MSRTSDFSIETKCVQAGWQPKNGEPRVLPIYQSTTFKYDEQGKVLAEKIAELWKVHYPENDIKAVPYEQIMEGFKHKFCYITTAVCESLGKTDDCYELTALRNYRDDYLMNTDCGEEIVKKYYDIAPTIVKHIDKRADRREIYEGIWNHYLKQCIEFIETDKNEQCKDKYAERLVPFYPSNRLCAPC